MLYDLFDSVEFFKFLNLFLNIWHYFFIRAIQDMKLKITWLTNNLILQLILTTSFREVKQIEKCEENRHQIIICLLNDDIVAHNVLPR